MSSRPFIRAALLLVFAVAVLLGAVASAQAIPPGCDNPDDCAPVETPHTSTLTVTAPPTAGAITGQDINCGVSAADCSEQYDWYRTCYDPPGSTPPSCEDDAPDVALTASRGPYGWAANWSGCSSSFGNSCSVDMSADRAVSLTWTDVGNPTVALVSAPDKASEHTVFTAAAADNDQVKRVDFYLAGVLAQSDASPPYQLDPNLATFEHGATVSISVIAVDNANRTSSSLDAAPGKVFEVDKETGLDGSSTPAQHLQAAPAVTFDPPDDVASVTCRTKRGATVLATVSDCASPYTAQLGGTPVDGEHTVELVVTDDVGNTATVVKGFTLDRVAPTLTVGDPGEGSVVWEPFTPSYTTSDAFTTTPEVRCRLDNEAFGSCAGLDPADGEHTLTVRSMDLAGNVRDVSRTITYDTTAPVVTITDGPAAGATVNGSSTSFTFSVVDLSAQQPECKLDAAQFTDCDAGEAQTLAGLAPGAHTFTVKVLDAGGRETVVTRSFTIAPAETADPGGTGATGGTGGTGGTNGAGDPPGGTGTGTPPPPSPPQSEGTTVEPLRLQVTSRFRVRRARTTVSALTLRGLTPGAVVKVDCRGRGCPFTSRTRTAKGSSVALKALFGKRALRPGAVLTIRVTQGGRTGALRLTTRRGKAPLRAAIA